MIAKEDIQYIEAYLKPQLNDFKNKTLFITGGTGFIGKWLVESLLHINQNQSLQIKLILLTRSVSKSRKHFEEVFPNNDLLFIEGDVINFEYPEIKIDFIIHAATDASATMNNENPVGMMDIIYLGTKHTLNLAVRDQAKVLFVSSGAVYGKQPDTIPAFTEEYNGASPMNTHLSAYGETKRCAEVLCMAYIKQYHLHISIARCFAFVGPYLPLDTHFAIGNFMGNVLRGEDIVVKSDGKPLRTYMYAADLVVWLMTILNLSQTGEAYNVGDDEAISIKDLAYLVRDIANQGEVQILNQNPPIYINLNYVCDVQKARDNFGFKQKIELREAIDKTLKYHRNANT